MNKPHKYAKEIIAWANGAEIEFRLDEFREWRTADDPTWNSYTEYRIKPQPVIKKMYMHYDGIERTVAKGLFDSLQVPQQMWAEDRAMGNHLEFTFTDGKLTSVEIVK